MNAKQKQNEMREVMEAEDEVTFVLHSLRTRVEDLNKQMNGYTSLFAKVQVGRVRDAMNAAIIIANDAQDILRNS